MVNRISELTRAAGKFEVPKVRFSFKVVDARIDARRGSLGGAKSRQARHRSLKLAFPRASNVELPVRQTSFYNWATLAHLPDNKSLL